jgi:5'-deoxynucleotidase YfbR-like HD superfamily hydrolase
MIVNILRPDLEQMRQHGYKPQEDEEESKIEERISQVRAEEILELWKKLKVKEEN